MALHMYVLLVHPLQMTKDMLMADITKLVERMQSDLPSAPRMPPPSCCTYIYKLCESQVTGIL